MRSTCPNVVVTYFQVTLQCSELWSHSNYVKFAEDGNLITFRALWAECNGLCGLRIPRKTKDPRSYEYHWQTKHSFHTCQRVNGTAWLKHCTKWEWLQNILRSSASSCAIADCVALRDWKSSITLLCRSEAPGYVITGGGSSWLHCEWRNPFSNLPTAYGTMSTWVSSWI